ncbi:hypothetical protein PACTADRAFT_47471 [Pachysolen tannophilus NRRL Y-2460]|uniref:Probable methionine--tRNA ligase, mitochondrial n=1 Tax=Pachysolen tannophilus NRRL Y-2460 TaxID=669874 RepID=A0A1E4U0R4_PACTA|nr:hypothetical protein PACTADRAFT_47471 [Pachysolen tannophilus NRRL Y-2460]
MIRVSTVSCSFTGNASIGSTYRGFKIFSIALSSSVKNPLSSNTTSITKPYYITTPIFYVNAAPHLGHLYSMLLCDIKTRWVRLSGKPAFFTTGTDEHGLKVQIASEKNDKKNPKEFCDELSVTFKELAKLTNINYDRFIRTTDDDHLQAVKKFWDIVYEKGYIYKGQHSGWYSVSDETFYPETQIEAKIDPLTNKEKFYSKETGTEVIYETEENYFFKLSKFRQPLIELLKQNQNFIIPRNYYEIILKELESEELQDLSISRPYSRLKWGIQVPEDPSQVIYVWFDALVNYLTSTGFPWSPTSLIQKAPLNNPWPASHLIGKDISRFHCIYWPSFLMAAGIELPKQVIVHGHWLMGGSKMSKSKGNIADPIEMANYYGTESLRFFLSENSVLSSDCDFTESRLNLSRNQFIDKICNLMLRSLSKNFSIERALSKYESGLYTNEQFIKSFDNPQAEKSIKSITADLNVLYERMDEEMKTFTTHKAINEIWKIVLKANALFNDAKPWTFKNVQDSQKEVSLIEDPLSKQDLIIFLSLETIRICSILLQPFIPELSNQLLDRLKVDSDKRMAKFAKVGKDLTYGKGVVFTKGSEVPLVKLPLREGALNV